MGHNSVVVLKNRKSLSFVGEAHCLEKTGTMASNVFAQNFGIGRARILSKGKGAE